MKFEKQDSGIESAHSAITLVKVASEELQTKNFLTFQSKWNAMNLPTPMFG